MNATALPVRPFRFGVNMVGHTTGEEWRARCRRAEELGYDRILVADHLGMPAPFPALVAAAAVTSRPRLGTFVLNAGFWNPALLAREVATTQALTDGRLELGLGTGYAQAEHEAAGIAFLPPGRRVDRLQRLVEALDRHLDGQTPPLVIGGKGDRVLRLAARHAEVAAFSGGGVDADGRPRPLSPEGLDERTAAYGRFEAEAGRESPAERNLLMQRVAITEDRAAAVAEFHAYVPHLTEKEVLDLPVLAVGTVQEIADRLRAQRARYGFSYVTVLQDSMEAFGEVVAELRKD